MEIIKSHQRTQEGNALKEGREELKIKLLSTDHWKSQNQNIIKNKIIWRKWVNGLLFILI